MSNGTESQAQAQAQTKTQSASTSNSTDSTTAAQLTRPRLAQVWAARGPSGATQSFKEALARVNAICRVPGLSLEEREQAFDTIREARAKLGAQTQKESTSADYAKKISLLSSRKENRDGFTEAELWLEQLIPYLASHNSFRGYKNAICWGLREQIRATLGEQDALQRSRAPAAVWLLAIEKLRSLLTTLREIEGTHHDSECWRSLPEIPKRRGTSKKQDLRIQRRRDPECLPKLVGQMSRTKYEEQAYTCFLVGARPEELKAGALIESASPETFSIKIRGAKRGQAWRKITLPNSVAHPRWIEALQAGLTHVVTVTSVAGLRESMRRQSRRVFQDPKVPKITPYSFRHALTTDLREDGATAEELGAVLGHLGSETSAGYGQRRRRGQRRKPPAERNILAVATAAPVRAYNRSGLDAVRTKRNAKIAKRQRK